MWVVNRNPPEVFMGIQAKAEHFLTQWKLYIGVNISNPTIANYYQRSMLFLTYIQGAGVLEWVSAMSECVKEFTPLCPTWAMWQMVMDWWVFALASTRGVSEQGEARGSGRDGMNLVVIEEHQVRDLVFAQIHYLYILLEATSAYVNVPIAKVP